MALTGCTESVMKEFNYLNDQSVRLVHGFDGEEKSAYYAVIKRTGMSLPLGHAEHGITTVVEMVSGDPKNYPHCSAKFAELVNVYL